MAIARRPPLPAKIAACVKSAAKSQSAGCHGLGRSPVKINHSPTKSCSASAQSATRLPTGVTTATISAAITMSATI